MERGWGGSRCLRTQDWAESDAGICGAAAAPADAFPFQVPGGALRGGENRLDAHIVFLFQNSFLLGFKIESQHFSLS